MVGYDKHKVSNVATELDVDCICMDCEESVALNRKEAARVTINR